MLLNGQVVAVGGGGGGAGWGVGSDGGGETGGNPIGLTFTNFGIFIAGGAPGSASGPGLVNQPGSGSNGADPLGSCATSRATGYGTGGCGATNGAGGGGAGYFGGGSGYSSDSRAWSGLGVALYVDRFTLHVASLRLFCTPSFVA